MVKKHTMALFGGKKTKQGRCPECSNYVYAQNKAFCAKAAPQGINIRLLSEDGIRRTCQPCPSEMSCEVYQDR